MAQQTPTQTPQELEQALRNFDKIATLLRRRGGLVPREDWRFEFDGSAYLLYFYPRQHIVHRAYRISPAMGQFTALQALQRAGIASPRAVAHLSGFRRGDGQIGDALIVESIDGAMSLDELVRTHWIAGTQVPNRRSIVEQVIQIVEAVGKAKLSHRDLGLGSFLVAEGKVYLHSVEDLRGGGMLLRDIYRFWHNVSWFATRTELLRAWSILNPDTMPPKKNQLDAKLWRGLVRRSRRENDDFGKLQIGEWTGHFVKTSRFARPWAAASRFGIRSDDWKSAWPMLLSKIDSDQLEILKRDASGDVLSGEVILSGRPISVIVKRPKRKRWYRYVTELVRPAKAVRMWTKAWQLIARGIACEWPMIVMQKRTLGYVTDALIVFERVPGTSLDKIDLDAIPPREREMLFRRAGRTTRAIERGGLAHYDAKSTNWIVFSDPAGRSIPVMIDVDGVRPLNIWLVAWGIRRLLRAMRQHPQYTPADSLALCQGYAPFARGEFHTEEEAAGAADR